MTARLTTFWKNLWGGEKTAPQIADLAAPAPLATTILPVVDITPNDPLLAYLHNVNGPVEIARLQMDSPGLAAMKGTGVVVCVPLVSQGELIGVINLGSRRSEQEYSSDDRKLLADLATQAAPAVRVAQLVRQQQLEAVERERMAQELAVAQLVQKTLLPQSLPELDGWAIAAYYQPARAVGGDFYDFRHLPDGKLAIVIGDVTDKGVPAALVMATTRTLLRAASERLVSPGAVLERVNDLLHPDIPARMFVTCLYAVLDPATGHLLYANAGHDLPYRAGPSGVEELRARGMPLGLLPGMAYEEKETTLTPGDTLLLYSDGLVEAH
ncbi:MAG: SpoIIE family protein phosphatase, partial [Chloroflexi bacterium]|nr:SpoIIE family protein phosphatase [Chloroflexota bacterium]